MTFETTLLTEERKNDTAAKGQWLNRTLLDYFDNHVAKTPTKIAITGYRTDRDKPIRLTFAELASTVDTIAANLMSLGVERQDVVSFQLPNWWEFVATSLACMRIGAIANCLMPILGENELRFMLQAAESKVLIVPKSFRGRDYSQMANNLLESQSTLEHIIIVDDEGENGFESQLLKDAPVDSLSQRSALDPNEVLLLMFSSGTTGEPKGVMHTSNTILKSVQALVNRMGVSSEDNVLSATPLGHLTGYAVLAVLPLMLGNTIVLQDVWDAIKALKIIEDEKVGFTAGATPFLMDLCDKVEEGAICSDSFRLFLCAGAPIPSNIVNRAINDMGLKVCSCWGMTEVVAGTVTNPELASTKSASTDGRPLEDVEIMIADENDKPLPPEVTGRLLIKTPTLFIGYLKRPDLSKLTSDGWFDTGDRAYSDAEGFIRISGRSKDLIIRGGENIPVAEVENILYTHPAVSTAAVVGFSDPRMGERACAYIVEKPGMEFTFEDMIELFSSLKVTKQFWPERLEIIDAMPTTSTGKIQKFKLREEARKFE